MLSVFQDTESKVNVTMHYRAAFVVRVLGMQMEMRKRQEEEKESEGRRVKSLAVFVVHFQPFASNGVGQNPFDEVKSCGASIYLMLL